MAHLTGDDGQAVHVTCVDDVQRFHVRHVKFEKKLADLERDIGLFVEETSSYFSSNDFQVRSENPHNLAISFFRHSYMRGEPHGEIMNDWRFKAQERVIYQSKTIDVVAWWQLPLHRETVHQERTIFLFQPDQTGRLCAGRMPLPSETYTYDQVEGSHQKFSYMRVQIIRRVNSEQRKQSVSFWWIYR